MTMTVTVEGASVAAEPHMADIETAPPLEHRKTTSLSDADKACQSMLSSLTGEEKEGAARTSYRYFLLSSSGEATQSQRDKYALAMARRHLVAEKGDQTLALKKMRATIQFRRDMDVDLLRQCYDKDPQTGKVSEATAEMREGIESEMDLGRFVVRGYDKGDRALCCCFPRMYRKFDAKWYLKTQMYMLERALACTERRSDGKREKVTVLFDYNGYTKKNAPPLHLAKSLMFCLRDHYPERLEYVFVVDAPLIFRAFWVLIRPFIDPITKEKVHFVSGEQAKREALSPIISDDQAQTFMFKEGKQTKPYDPKYFLREIPFVYAYEEDY